MIEKNRKYYLPRDISWMYFNNRILLEAQRKEVPLLNRLTFLGIYSNNLDEFYRVRVASQNRIAECDGKYVHAERKTAELLLQEISKLNKKYSIDFEKTIQEVEKELSNKGVNILNETQLDDNQKKFVKEYFEKNINGLFYPMWMSSIKQLDSCEDENIFLAISMCKIDDNTFDYAVISLPNLNSGRFVVLPDKDNSKCLMYLDDVLRFCMPYLFRGTDYTDFQAYSFKFTKDAEMEIDNDIHTNILQKISKAVNSRSSGLPIRIIYDKDMPKPLLKMVLTKFNLSKYDTVLSGGRYQNHKDFISFPDIDKDNLKYPLWPQLLKQDLNKEKSILKLIQEKDRFLHVPYYSFDSFVRILQEASIDKDVKEIKISLYRLASDSKIVRALVNAAKNGKKVTVVIELLARFDESSNINWSKKMQEAGIHVIFGVEGLKVHSKVLYINIRKGADIACVSTGNFHEGNARSYTDFILMTANKEIVKDVMNVFEFIEKPYKRFNFKHLLVSPKDMRNRFTHLISNEIKNKMNGKPAYIKVKINHVTDSQIIKKLYDASSKGVKIEMLVRGNCSIITGICGVSENIKINGIIDRYLEHSRIFIFANGGDEKIFIGSADWMPRNLDNRVEVVSPVFDFSIKEEVRRIVDYGLRDTANGRIVDGTGKNKKWEGLDNIPFRSQEELYKYYVKENSRK